MAPSCKILLYLCLTHTFYCGLSQHHIEQNSGFQVYKDLGFSPADNSLTLDLFIPNGLTQSTPCIVVIKGGGFLSQDGQPFRFIAEYIAQNNYIAALISYRGRPDHTYETTLADIRASITYVKNNSDHYNINPNRIGAVGRSAGGTLAALMAVDPDKNSKIHAAVAYAGVFDFESRFTDSLQIALQPEIQKKIISNGEWVGVPFATQDKHWRRVSAISHVDADDPPIFFMHCKDDRTVPWPQSQAMYDKMIDAGIHAEIRYFETGGHGFRVGSREVWLAPMMDFFKRQFE
ncbi:MAG: alpha/beta hydrolase [Cyclobacteriaceae bacterium]